MPHIYQDYTNVQFLSHPFEMKSTIWVRKGSTEKIDVDADP